VIGMDGDLITSIKKYEESLLESWYIAEKKNGGVSHCYDGYDDGVSRGLIIALELFGITKEQRDAYYINHK
jgi:hypothetical protein